MSARFECLGAAFVEDHHVANVVIALLGPDHHTEEWNFIDHGKEIKEFFDLTRKN